MKHLLAAKNWEQKGSVLALKDLTEQRGTSQKWNTRPCGQCPREGRRGDAAVLTKVGPRVETPQARSPPAPPTRHAALPSDRTCPDLSFPICSLPPGVG